MKKSTRIWLISAAAAVFAGICICMYVLLDFYSGTEVNNMKTSSHEIREAFRNISIETETGDISLLPSEDGSCRVICSDVRGTEYEVYIENDSLTVRPSDPVEWYRNWGLFRNSQKISVYLPEKAYGTAAIRSNTGEIDIPSVFRFEEMTIEETTGEVCCEATVSGKLEIHATTGEVELKNLCAESIVCTATTGETELENVTCGDLLSDGSTGDISLVNVLVKNSMQIRRSTGDVKLKSCDAGDIRIETTTGDITGTLLTGKMFSAGTSTGSVQIPEPAGEGDCRMNTTTGDVLIHIEK